MNTVAGLLGLWQLFVRISGEVIGGMLKGLLFVKLGTSGLCTPVLC